MKVYASLPFSIQEILPYPKHFVAVHYCEPVVINLEDWSPLIFSVAFLFFSVVLIKSIKRYVINSKPDELRSLFPELDVLIPYNKMEQDPLEGNTEHSEIKMSDDEGYIN